MRRRMGKSASLWMQRNHEPKSDSCIQRANLELPDWSCWAFWKSSQNPSSSQDSAAHSSTAVGCAAVLLSCCYHITSLTFLQLYGLPALALVLGTCWQMPSHDKVHNPYKSKAWNCQRTFNIRQVWRGPKGTQQTGHNWVHMIQRNSKYCWL